MLPHCAPLGRILLMLQRGKPCSSAPLAGSAAAAAEEGKGRGPNSDDGTPLLLTTSHPKLPKKLLDGNSPLPEADVGDPAFPKIGPAPPCRWSMQGLGPCGGPMHGTTIGTKKGEPALRPMSEGSSVFPAERCQAAASAAASSATGGRDVAWTAAHGPQAPQQAATDEWWCLSSVTGEASSASIITGVATSATGWCRGSAGNNRARPSPSYSSSVSLQEEGAR